MTREHLAQAWAVAKREIRASVWRKGAFVCMALWFMFGSIVVAVTINPAPDPEPSSGPAAPELFEFNPEAIGPVDLLLTQITTYPALLPFLLLSIFMFIVPLKAQTMFYQEREEQTLPRLLSHVSPLTLWQGKAVGVVAIGTVYFTVVMLSGVAGALMGLSWGSAPDLEEPTRMTATVIGGVVALAYVPPFVAGAVAVNLAFAVWREGTFLNLAGMAIGFMYAPHLFTPVPLAESDLGGWLALVSPSIGTYRLEAGLVSGWEGLFFLLCYVLITAAVMLVAYRLFKIGVLRYATTK